MPPKDVSSEPRYLYSPDIIEPAAHSMADAFIARVLRYNPEDRELLVRLVRQRLELNAPDIAAFLAGKD